MRARVARKIQRQREVVLSPHESVIHNKFGQTQRSERWCMSYAYYHCTQVLAVEAEIRVDVLASQSHTQDYQLPWRHDDQQ